jgi:hypothetical protein
MTLIDAPAYDPRRDNLIRNLLIGSAVFIFLAIVLGMSGYVAGHGWFFSNIPAEHKVSHFLDALEAKDYPKAYGIYYNDTDWQQHPDKYHDYPLPRFTEDWTTFSPIKAPVTSYHIDVSRTDGTGVFGTTIIVGVTVNGGKRVFFNVLRSDGSLTCCSATHEIVY